MMRDVDMDMTDREGKNQVRNVKWGGVANAGKRGKREGEETATPNLAMVIQQTQLETPKAI